MRAARRLGGQRRFGLAARGRGLVEGHLGQLELEQPGREVVAPVVHQTIERQEGLGPARKVDLGAQRLHVGCLRRQCVGVGLRLGELVEAAGDGLRRAQLGEGDLLGGGGGRRRRLGFGGLLDGLRQALVELVGALGRSRSQDRRSVGRGLRHFALDRLRFVFERLLQVAVALGAKQALEDLLAVLAARLQQLLELALGEHDDLPELDAAKPQDALDLFAHVGRLGGQGRALGASVACA